MIPIETKSKWSYLEFQNNNNALFVPNSHVCVKRHPSQFGSSFLALELELKITKEKCNSHSVPVSFSHCRVVISHGLGMCLWWRRRGGGSKQLDEPLASQSLVLNISSVFIEFLKKQMQAKRMNSSR